MTARSKPTIETRTHLPVAVRAHTPQAEVKVAARPRVREAFLAGLRGAGRALRTALTHERFGAAVGAVVYGGIIGSVVLVTGKLAVGVIALVVGGICGFVAMLESGLSSHRPGERAKESDYI